jgi:hypothetical protein
MDQLPGSVGWLDRFSPEAGILERGPSAGLNGLPAALQLRAAEREQADQLRQQVGTGAFVFLSSFGHASGDPGLAATKETTPSQVRDGQGKPDSSITAREGGGQEIAARDRKP